MLRAPSVCYFAKYSITRCQWIQIVPEATPYFVRTVYVWYFYRCTCVVLAGAHMQASTLESET
jgi:hypothetical protein